MTGLDEIYQIAKQFWVVWLFVLFVGIIGYTLWPRNKERLEAHADIPFLDND